MYERTRHSKSKDDITFLRYNFFLFRPNGNQSDPTTIRHAHNPTCHVPLQPSRAYLLDFVLVVPAGFLRRLAGLLRGIQLALAPLQVLQCEMVLLLQGLTLRLVPLRGVGRVTCDLSTNRS